MLSKINKVWVGVRRRKMVLIGTVIALMMLMIGYGAGASERIRAEQMTVYYRTDLNIVVDGQPTTLRVTPFIVDPGWIMVPVEFIAKEMGAQVHWDGATSTFTITTPDKHTPPAPVEPLESRLPGDKVTLLPVGPAEKEGYISLEGMLEPFTFYRLHAVELGMVTYVPADLKSQTVAAANGDEVRIWAAFGGQNIEDTYLSLLLMDAGIPLQEVKQDKLHQLYEAGYTTVAIDTTEVAEHRWAHAAYRFTGVRDGKIYTGTVAFGNRGQRVLVVEMHTDITYEEGFYPRYRAVMDAMEWYGF